jgi:multidrug resistance efflux pump
MKRLGLGNLQFGRLRQHALPVLVWLGALACVAVMFRHRAQRFEVLGVAQGQVRQVAATCTGRLRNVPVQLFQEVKAGDVVAVIDTILDNEHLEAELAATSDRFTAEAANLETDRFAAYRRFCVDVENARLGVLELKAAIETDRIMLEDLKLNAKIFTAQSISDYNDAAYYERQRKGVEYNALAKKIEDNQHLLAQAEDDLLEAQRRRDEFTERQLQHPSLDTALEVTRRAIEVQEREIDRLLARREPLVLTAPIDGVVSQILRRPVRRTGEGVVRQMIRRAGEAVLDGEPILTISAREPDEILAYASREQSSRVRIGMEVEVIKETEPARIARSEVMYLGPIMEVMPQRLWIVPNVPGWGRPMLIKIPAGLKLLPGEVVGIKVL